MKDVCKTILEHPIATCIVLSALTSFMTSVAKLAKKAEKSQ